MKTFPIKTSRVNEDERHYPYIEEGMDLRDYFAIHSTVDEWMPYADRIINEHNSGNTIFNDYKSIKKSPEIISQAKYEFADDMIKQRN